MASPKPVTNDTLRSEARSALRSVMNDGNAPAAARAAAARTILESLGDIGRLQDAARLGSVKGLTEMTADEIDQEIARLRPKEM